MYGLQKYEKKYVSRCLFEKIHIICVKMQMDRQDKSENILVI